MKSWFSAEISFVTNDYNMYLAFFKVLAQQF